MHWLVAGPHVITFFVMVRRLPPLALLLLTVVMASGVLERNHPCNALSQQSETWVHRCGAASMAFSISSRTLHSVRAVPTTTRQPILPQRVGEHKPFVRRLSFLISRNAAALPPPSLA